ncbi:RNA-binding S4 domain-containing protein [Stenoxybacter acetivorans]|uniref:RNA-binding S4 domain-containing protein n=1 Tax=Stenoxybacter acetivorans TaxID=422441 RepID=UPI00056795DC|nr:RNA-binding S4 domain-containing protein [Stenoxybacter acetivorans]
MTHDFNLDGHEYVALCDLLKHTGLADSGGQAKHWIAEGRVLRGGVVEQRKTAKIRVGEIISLGDVFIRVVQA